MVKTEAGMSPYGILQLPMMEIKCLSRDPLRLEMAQVFKSPHIECVRSSLVATIALLLFHLSLRNDLSFARAQVIFK